MRPVVDLLVEQVEVADFVLLNKVDLLPGGMQGEALEQLQAIVASLNPLATVIACQDAKVCGAWGVLIGQAGCGTAGVRPSAPIIQLLVVVHLLVSYPASQLPSIWPCYSFTASASCCLLCGCHVTGAS